MKSLPQLSRFRIEERRLLFTPEDNKVEAR